MAVDANIGTAWISVVPDTDKLAPAIKDALKGAEKSAVGSGSNMGQGLTSGINKTLKAGVVGAGLAAGGVLATSLAKGFGRRNALDQAEAKLKGLGFSADEITRSMEGVTKSVKGTAFGLDEAAGSAAKLTGVGVAVGDELDRSLTLTADIAAQSGTSMDDISSVMAKIAGGGKLTGETLAQLEDRATGASGALADHLGVSIEEVRKQVSEGAVDFETFQAAMEGHIGGAAQATGETFQGAFDNMGAAMGRLGDKLITPVFNAAPAVFGAIGGAFDTLGEKLEPLIEDFAEWLAPRMEDFAANTVPKLVDGVMSAVDAFIEFGGWVKDNAAWIKPLAAGIGGAVAAIYAWNTATTIATAVQTIFNKVIEANKLMLIVTAVAAVVAALVYFFTQTETGKAVWETFTNFLKSAWSSVSETFTSVWEWIKTNVFDAFGIKVQEVQIWWQNTTGQLKAAWQDVQMVFSAVWEAIKTAVFDAWNWYVEQVKANWEMVTSALNSAWTFVKDTFTSVWNAIKTAVFDAWNAYVNQVKANWDTVTNALNSAWTALKDHFTSIWNTIKTSVLDAWNTAVNFLRDTFNTVTTTISDKWTWLKDQMSNVWSWIRDNVLTKFEQGLDKLKSFFSDVVNGIQIVWNKLRGHLAKPINFMINTVYNDGILKAWNTMADILPGLSPGTRLSGIPEHATGGRISGPGTGTSDDVLMWGSNGEHMLTAEEVKKFGGHDNIYRLRAMLRDNIPFTTNGRGQVVPLPRGIDNKAGDLYGAAPDLLPAYATGGEIRPLWEQQLERGHAWASARHGRPYDFGGSAHGGGGTDCSGFMSGIADVIQGGDGSRKWATMSFANGNTAQGFVPGLGPGFSIGLFNGGPYGGHTAGTLGAAGNYTTTNVESGGSPSMVKYGTGAVGADHSQFTHQYHLPIGADGAFVSGGAGGFDFMGAVKKWITDKLASIIDPIKDKLPSGPPAWQDIPGGVYNKSKDALTGYIAEKIEGLGSLVSGVWTKITDLFDSGGVLQSGRMAMNLSGKPEAILTNSQWGKFNKMVGNMPALTESLEVIAEEISAAFNGGDWGMGELAHVLGDEKLAESIINGAAALGEISRTIGEQAQKSGEEYVTEQATGALDVMGLGGLVPLGQKLGAKAWDLYQASPYEVGFNGQSVTVEIEAESDADLIRVSEFKRLADQVHGLDVKVNQRPSAASITRGGVM